MDKWGLLRQTIINATQGEGEQTAKGARVFDLILRLFAHEDVVGGK
jgi:hypothetical protein